MKLSESAMCPDHEEPTEERKFSVEITDSDLPIQLTFMHTIKGRRKPQALPCIRKIN